MNNRQFKKRVMRGNIPRRYRGRAIRELRDCIRRLTFELAEGSCKRWEAEMELRRMKGSKP